jgi:hypothetical protein
VKQPPTPEHQGHEPHVPYLSRVPAALFLRRIALGVAFLMFPLPTHPWGLVKADTVSVF